MNIKDPVKTNFAVLAGNLSPADAISRISGNRYGIVVDQDDNPVSVIMRKDLTWALENHAPKLISVEAALPPTIIIPSGTTVAQIMESRVSGLLDFQPNGLVVMAAAGIAGVLPTKFFSTQAIGLVASGKAASYAIGDSGLGGVIGVPEGIFFCKEEGCGYPNTIVSIDEDDIPWCKNTKLLPHRVKLS